MQHSRETLILKLRRFGKISVRGLNVCQENNILNLGDLIDYQVKHKDFLGLKKIGRKTNQELEILSDGFGENLSMFPNEKDSILQRYQKLDFDQQLRLTSIFTNLRQEVSKRTDNIIYELARDGRLISFLEKCEAVLYDLGRFRNVGRKTESELTELLGELEISLGTLSNPEHKKAEIRNGVLGELKLFLGNISLEDEHFIDESFIELSTGKFPLLSFFQFSIVQTSLLKRRTKDIVLCKLGYIEGYSHLETLDLCVLYGITNERIRQLCSQLQVQQHFWNPLKELLNYLLNIGLRLNSEMVIEKDSDFQLLDIEFLNQKNRTKFTPAFLGNFFSLLNPNYEAVSIKGNGKFSVLIHSLLLKGFNMQCLFEEVSNLILKRIPEPIKMNVSVLVEKWSKAPAMPPALLLRVESIVMAVLERGFGLKVEGKGSFEIPRNTKKKVHEHIEDVLRDKGSSMHIMEISLALEEVGLNIKPEGLRSHLLRFPAVFMVAGASTYGLKTWEANGDVVGGTIKAVVERYLSGFDTPKHILEITRYVRQFRDTNLQSILANLQSDPLRRFQNFGNMFFGISKKDYPQSQTVSSNKHWFRHVKSNLYRDENSEVSVNQIIEFAVSKFGVQGIQIEFLLEQLQEKGKILISEGKMVRLL